MSLGESVSSGPFFKAYIANLLPGQFIQPFIDAAFSDLGLDPNVLAAVATDRSPDRASRAPRRCRCPSRAPVRAANRNLNLPDAITGNPGDTRYPYREPLPAPPPGGPAAGPAGRPAASPARDARSRCPTPSRRGTAPDDQARRPDRRCRS